MKEKTLKKGDLFQVREQQIKGYFSLFGIKSTITTEQFLPNGTYYVIEESEDKNCFLFLMYNTLRMGFIY